MLYKLEKRGTGLAIPTTLYNFMLTNGIKYTYNFQQEGIELTETDYNRVILCFKPGFKEKAVKYTGTDRNPVKNENMRSNTKQKRRKLI